MALGSRKKASANSSRRSSLSTKTHQHASTRRGVETEDYEPEVDKMALLRRYGGLLKTTVISFVLSTLIHIGIVLAYYYIYLYTHPDDPGKKKFYATTTTSPGVKIGNRMVGRGGVQSNSHKSYLLHLVREHYKAMSPMFFVQFSVIYLALLFLFKFFPEREKLRVDTMNAFHLNGSAKTDADQEEEELDEHVHATKTTKLARKNLLLRKRLSGRQPKENVPQEENDEFETTDEEADDNNFEEMSCATNQSEEPDVSNEQVKKDN